MTSMKLIAISWPEFFKGEADIINDLFAAGLYRLHVRKPDADEASVSSLIAQIDPSFHSRLAIHYFPTIALQTPGAGIHLSHGTHYVPPHWNGTISRSCHTIAEAEREKTNVDYLFLSPIFDSVSKSGYKAAFSEDELREAARRGVIDGKVIALGGITPANVGRVAELGFGGVAVLGGLWGDLSHDDVMIRFGEYGRGVGE